MSLQSNGSSFEVSVQLRDVYEEAKNFGGLSVPHEQLNKMFSGDLHTTNCGIEAKKEAFMALMKVFSDSPEFEALTYQLNNTFIICVNHDVHLSMND